MHAVILKPNAYWAARHAREKHPLKALSGLVTWPGKYSRVTVLSLSPYP